MLSIYIHSPWLGYPIPFVGFHQLPWLGCYRYTPIEPPPLVGYRQNTSASIVLVESVCLSSCARVCVPESVCRQNRHFRGRCNTNPTRYSTRLSTKPAASPDRWRRCNNVTRFIIHTNTNYITNTITITNNMAACTFDNDYRKLARPKVGEFVLEYKIGYIPQNNPQNSQRYALCQTLFVFLTRLCAQTTCKYCSQVNPPLGDPELDI